MDDECESYKLWRIRKTVMQVRLIILKCITDIIIVLVIDITDYQIIMLFTFSYKFFYIT